MNIYTSYNVEINDNLTYNVTLTVSEWTTLPDNFDINDDEQIIDLVKEIWFNKCKSPLEEVRITPNDSFLIEDDNYNKTKFKLYKFKKGPRSKNYDYKLVRPEHYG